jgi:hypothetical protein
MVESALYLFAGIFVFRSCMGAGAERKVGTKLYSESSRDDVQMIMMSLWESLLIFMLCT